MVLQFLINGFVAGSVYALIALGFGVIYNTTGGKVLHIAHGGVYTISAYLFYTFIKLMGFSLPISLFLTLVLTVGCGVLMERMIYFPLQQRKASHGVIILSSLGIFLLCENLIALIFGMDSRNISFSVETISLGKAIITKSQIVEILTFIFLFFVFFLFIQKSKIGRILHAVSSNSALSMAIGINISKARIIAFAIGSFLVSVASCLDCWVVGIEPTMGIQVFFIAIAATIIGGTKSFQAPAFGALILGVMNSLVLWKIPGMWADAVTFFLLLLFILVMPHGLLGKKRRVEQA